jgi:hypothetical protein
MKTQMGVIRDKDGIYAGLLQSQSLAHQLAVCYHSEDRLVVKICTVINIAVGDEPALVTLRTRPEDPPATEIVVSLDHIESIYPISDF